MFLDLSGPHDQRVELYYRYKFLKVNHHLVKFGGHRHCGSGYVFICHVISSDHATKGYSNITGRRCSRFIAILPNSVVIGTVVVNR